MLRLLHTSAQRLASFRAEPGFALKCGLEIHTQLKTTYKLFSLSKTGPLSSPNSQVSYFDCGLPGTQPKLNPEALLLALRAAVALNCDVQQTSSFDRKHYFYPDQPLGYQITQFYHPIARNGHLDLDPRFDIVPLSKRISLERIQIEQDTGKSAHDAHDQVTRVDLNRANVPLIELVTNPDFESLDQVKAFFKKYTTLVKHLDICTGDLETGAMRVDVNISVNGGNRVEIKNLGSTGEIAEAVAYEYRRQVRLLRALEPVPQETRGWNGSETVRSRSKEDAVDYRYLPDAELPRVYLDPPAIVAEIRATLPVLPEEIMAQLVSAPHLLETKHARFLVDNRDLLAYYRELFALVGASLARAVNNWLFNELLGIINKLKLPLDLAVLPPSKFAEMISMVAREEITYTAGKILLQQYLQAPAREQQFSVRELVEHYDLAQPMELSLRELDGAVEDICREIMAGHGDVVAKVRLGKHKSLNFLIGLAMRETKGKVKSTVFEAKLKELLRI